MVRRATLTAPTRVLAAVFLTVVALGPTACATDKRPPDPDAVAAGATLYEQSCASCHGSDLRGTDKGPPHLSEVYASDHHSDDSFRSAITNGAPSHHWDFGDMPPVPSLSDEDITSILAFVRQQQATQELEAYPPG